MWITTIPPNEIVIAEAVRVARRYGKAPTAADLWQITQDMRLYVSEGCEWQDAVSYATTLVLRLYAVEDAPWLVPVARSRGTG